MNYAPNPALNGCVSEESPGRLLENLTWDRRPSGERGEIEHTDGK